MSKYNVTVDEFCEVTKYTRSAVSKLIHLGNSIRKLKAKKVKGRVYILSSELDNFPITYAGKNNKTYTYPPTKRIPR